MSPMRTHRLAAVDALADEPVPEIFLVSMEPEQYTRDVTTHGATLRAAARDVSARLNRRYVSRSYAGHLAVAAGHDYPVGVDLEAVTHFERTEATSFLTPAELTRPIELDDESCTSIWSGKEALAKALGDARAYDPRRLDSPATWHDSGVGRLRAGRWRAERLGGLPAGVVGWVCWQAPSVSEPGDRPDF